MEDLNGIILASPRQNGSDAEFIKIINDLIAEYGREAGALLSSRSGRDWHVRLVQRDGKTSLKTDWPPVAPKRSH